LLTGHTAPPAAIWQVSAFEVVGLRRNIRSWQIVLKNSVAGPKYPSA
jgi:hypothetical protein